MILINGKIHTMAEPEIIESGFIEIQDKKIEPQACSEGWQSHRIRSPDLPQD